MPTPGEIAAALTDWIYHWGGIENGDPRGPRLIEAFLSDEQPNQRPNPLAANLRRGAQDTLRGHSQEAAADLAARLTGLGLRPVPDDLTARAHNLQAAPEVPAIVLQDLLTPLQDLRTIGGTDRFDPARTFRSVATFIRSLERLQAAVDP